MSNIVANKDGNLCLYCGVDYEIEREVFPDMKGRKHNCMGTYREAEKCPEAISKTDIDICHLEGAVCLLESGGRCQSYEEYLKRKEK